MFKLKSDYFRIEIEKLIDLFDTAITLKSDYFRIEILAVILR